MPTKQYAPIAREGHGTLLLVAICASVLNAFLGFYAAIPAWLLLVSLFYQFRDPTEIPPPLPLAIVSPIHGTIVRLGTARDPWLKRTAESIVIETGLFDVHSIYAPTEGKIMEQWRCVPNPAPNDDDPPHSSAYWIQTDEGDDIVLVITQGAWGGRISFDYHPGERVGHGRRIGFANLGCKARLYLPLGSRYEVARASKVAAGSSIVGTLIHLTRMARPVVSGEAAVASATADDVH